MNKLVLMALVCLGLGAEVLAGCGCGAARAIVGGQSSSTGGNSTTVAPKPTARPVARPAARPVAKPVASKPAPVAKK